MWMRRTDGLPSVSVGSSILLPTAHLHLNRTQEVTLLSGLVRHAHAAMGDWDEESMGRCGGVCPIHDRSIRLMGRAITGCMDDG